MHPIRLHYKSGQALFLGDSPLKPRERWRLRQRFRWAPGPGVAQIALSRPEAADKLRALGVNVMHPFGLHYKSGQALFLGDSPLKPRERWRQRFRGLLARGRQAALIRPGAQTNSARSART